MKLKTSYEQVGTWRLENYLGVFQFAQEIRQNRGILNRVQVSWARRAEVCITNDNKRW
jgi:hypothetical protein